VVGNAQVHQSPHISYHEDQYGGTGTRHVPRPVLAHFLYNALPRIDEHNKQRQSVLAVERKWPMTCRWFKLLAGFVGMSAVNMQRIYAHRFPNIQGKDLHVNSQTGLLEAYNSEFGKSYRNDFEKKRRLGP
jgi:hypothetical protein